MMWKVTAKTRNTIICQINTDFFLKEENSEVRLEVANLCSFGIAQVSIKCLELSFEILSWFIFFPKV